MSDNNPSRIAKAIFFKHLHANNVEALLEAFHDFSEADCDAVVAEFKARPEQLNAFLDFLRSADDHCYDALSYLWERKREGRSNTDTFESWIEASLVELEAHQQRYNMQAPVYLKCRHYPSETGVQRLEIKINIFAERVGELLWDSANFETADPVTEVLFCTPYSPLISYESKPLKPWVPCPLFRYHPERYKQTRRYIKQIPMAFAQHGLDLSHVTQECLGVIAQEIMEDMNRTGADEPLREKLKTETAPAALPTKELETYIFHNAFVRSGRQIFDLTENLVEMFRHTSVDEVPVDLLTSPFKDYYLYFGPQPDLALKQHWYPDGVYVQHYPESKIIQFLFTLVPNNPSKVRRWTKHPEPSFVLSINQDHFFKKLGDAVTAVIDERRIQLEEKIAKGDRDITKELLEAAGDAAEDFPRVIEKAETTGRIELDELEASIPVMRQCLELAVNAMCYLTGYPDDINKEWTADAPKTLVVKASKGHPTVKKNTQSKLESMGYHKINICGRALNQGPVVSGSGTGEGGRTVRRHWRRGHWRPQAHGPQHSLRKLVMIKPTMVNRGPGGGDDIPGSIYISENVVDLRQAKKKRN